MNLQDYLLQFSGEDITARILVVDTRPVYAVNQPVWFQHGQAARIVYVSGDKYKVQYDDPLVIDSLKIPRWRWCTAGELDKWQAQASARLPLKATG